MPASKTGDPGQRPRRSRLQKALLGVGIALSALALAEGALQASRGLGMADYSISPLPQPRPMQVVCGVDAKLKLCPDRGERYERVRPLTFTPAPAAGIKRIITIGESFVHGLNLPMASAWPARLDHHLGDNVEVLNFGRCGSHAGILHYVVEAATRLKPDLIVLSVGNNEHSMTTFFTGWAGRHPLLAYRLLRGLSRFQLPGVLNQLLGSPLRVMEEWDVTRQRFEDPVDQRIYAARRRPPDLEWFKGGLASARVTAALEQEKQLKELVFAEHLRDMIRRCKAAGVPVLITTLPIQLLWAPVLSGCHAEDGKTCQEVIALLDRIRQAPAKERGEKIIQAMELEPGVAAVHFEAGKYMLGREGRSRAAEALRQATRLDLLPDNTPAINATIRRLAREEGVPLADLDLISAKVLDNPGRVFIDRVHLTAAGSDLVGKEVAEAVARILAGAKGGAS